MVTPVERRAWVAWVREAFQCSMSAACRATGVHRSLITHRSRKAPQTALRARLRELAASRVSYGSPRLYVLLRREAWPVNHKRVDRLYREEGLQLLRRKRPRRRRSAVTRGPRLLAQRPMDVGAMDFVHDTLLDGSLVRVVTLIDTYHRECLALVAQRRFRGEDVARILSLVITARGAPTRITVDNGTEFTSRAVDAWAYWNHVQLDFSRPGKPVDNTFIEAFNGSLRRECLSQHWFASMAEAQQILNGWQDEYNNERPHSSLHDHSPRSPFPGGYFTPNPDRLATLRI